MFRTYKYRLYPTRVQEKTLDFLLMQGRLIYNDALEQRLKVYRETGESVSYPQQWAHFRDLRHAHPDTLGRLNATSVQQILRRLDKAFKAFFRRLKAGEKPGFPRFKGCNRFNSLEYRYGDGCKLRFSGGRARFYVQNVGEIKVKYHRPLPEGAQIKHVILKRRNRRWYICLMLELPEPAVIKEHPGPAVGIDVGLHHLLALSNGETVDNPRWLRRSLAKLRVAQRRMARRLKGSRGWREAAYQVARLHERIAHQRRDFWHKFTRKLVDTYSLVVLEDLNLAFMTANSHLALSAHDAGLAEFRQLLAYKAESAGTRVVFVNPAFTSQLCSFCGAVVVKDLSVRVHECSFCGYTADRDVNAARNILSSVAVKSAWTGPPGVLGHGVAVPVQRASPGKLPALAGRVVTCAPFGVK